MIATEHFRYAGDPAGIDVLTAQPGQTGATPDPEAAGIAGADNYGPAHRNTG